MIELLFLVCLAAAPSDCRNEQLPFVDVSLMTCTLGAPVQLAAWTEHHPEWRIARWNCGVHDPSRADT